MLHMNTKITAILVILPAILAATALVVPGMMVTASASNDVDNGDNGNDVSRSACSAAASSNQVDDTPASASAGFGGNCIGASAVFPPQQDNGNNDD
jgi:hypothetical protein